MLAGKLGGIALRLRARKAYRRFEESARHPRAAQERVLLGKIRRNQDSRFGREHRFRDIHTVEDFRRALPVSDYDRTACYIEEVKRGDVRAMFGPDESVLMFALTSGAYSRPKHIPVTRSFLAEYRLGWHVWGHAVTCTHMAAYDHGILRIVSPKNEGTTEADVSSARGASRCRRRATRCTSASRAGTGRSSTSSTSWDTGTSH